MNLVGEGRDYLSPLSRLPFGDRDWPSCGAGLAKLRTNSEGDSELTGDLGQARPPIIEL